MLKPSIYVACALLVMTFGSYAAVKLASIVRNGPVAEKEVSVQVPEVLSIPVCAPVHVTCECPAYEQGWDDAEWAQGAAPENEPYGYSEEDLRSICAEIEAYGEVPDC